MQLPPVVLTSKMHELVSTGSCIIFTGFGMWFGLATKTTTCIEIEFVLTNCPKLIVYFYHYAFAEVNQVVPPFGNSVIYWI